MAESQAVLDAELDRARDIARRYHFEVVDLADFRPDIELLRSVPLDLMVRYQFLPIAAPDHHMVIAMADPTDLARLDELESKLDRRLVIKVAAPSQVRDFLKKTDPSQRVLDEATSEFRLDVIRDDEGGEEGLSLEHMVQDREVDPMIKLVDSLVFAGLERRASDIHIESRDNSVVVKYRIDGVLQQASALAREHQSTLITRIKVMAELDIAERRVPQDGRFRVRYRGRPIDFRVSIMPSIHGEDAVLRILDKESLHEKFRQLRLEVLGLAGPRNQAAAKIHPRALRHGAGDGTDGQRQDHDALRRAFGDQKRRRQDHHHRRSGRVSAPRRYPDSGERKAWTDFRSRSAVHIAP